MAPQISPLAGHPKLVLEQLGQIYGRDLFFEFSVYQHTRGLVVDRREVFRAHLSEISDAWVLQLLQSLPKGQELALNSRILVAGSEVAHIPMVDFSTQALAQVGKLESYLPQELYSTMIWFDSGRSFHGYSTCLISEAQWREFMGRLLLVNRPGFPSIVDPRWIGHRLIAGYSALRWSRNTSKHLLFPKVAAWHPSASVLGGFPSANISREPFPPLFPGRQFRR